MLRLRSHSPIAGKSAGHEAGRLRQARVQPRRQLEQRVRHRQHRPREVVPCFQLLQRLDAELGRHVAVVVAVDPEHRDVELRERGLRVDAARADGAHLCEHLRARAARRALALARERSPRVRLAGRDRRPDERERPAHGVLVARPATGMIHPAWLSPKSPTRARSTCGSRGDETDLRLGVAREHRDRRLASHVPRDTCRSIGRCRACRPRAPRCPARRDRRRTSGTPRASPGPSRAPCRGRKGAGSRAAGSSVAASRRRAPRVGAARRGRSACPARRCPTHRDDRAVAGRVAEQRADRERRADAVRAARRQLDQPRREAVRAHDRDDGTGRAPVQTEELQHLRRPPRARNGAAQRALRTLAREHAALRRAVEDDVRGQPGQREAHMGPANRRRDVVCAGCAVPHDTVARAPCNCTETRPRRRAGKRYVPTQLPAAARAAAADRGAAARTAPTSPRAPPQRTRHPSAHSRSSSAQRMPYSSRCRWNQS